MRIAIGSDHAGFDLKEEAKAFLLEENHEILDVGTYSKAPVDYPDYAEAVATALREYRVIDILLSLEEVEVETCLTCVAGSEIRTNSKLAKITTS